MKRKTSKGAAQAPVPIRIGDVYGTKSKPRRRKMQSEISYRTVNVSADNIKSQIETFLRTLGSISDSEDLKNIEFKDPTPDGVFPLVLEIRREVAATKGNA